MDDVRQFLLSVAVDVVHAEFLSQQHIDLDRNDRVFLAEYVLVLHIQLRSVECRFVDTDLILQAKVVEDRLHRCLCSFPLLCRSFIFIIRVGRIPLGEAEGTVIQHAYRSEEILEQIHAAAELVFQLIRTDHQMSLRDRKLTHTDQAVHFAGILVTEQCRSLTQSHRQVAIASFAVQIYLILERACHRTQRKALLRLIVRITDHEHSVQIMIPVAGDLVQLTFCHKRCLGQQIAVLLLHIFYPALQQLNHSCALGHQDRQTLADIIYRCKVFQLTTKLVMIALSRLFSLCQELIQLFLALECDTVDTLEHLIVGIASPVCTCRAQQLKSVMLYIAGRIQMRACAQIRKLALLVEGDLLAVGNTLDQLYLVRLVLHQFQRLILRQYKSLQRKSFLADLLHFLLDLFQHFRRERYINIHIVIPAFIDRRTDRQFYLRIQSLYRLRHNM